MSEEILIDANPPPSLVNATHLIYALHALSLLIGITTAATIIGAFVFGIPSIIAVIVNYLKRGEARGTFLDSHFRWQIRTFWFGLLWCLIGGFLFVTFIGIPLAMVVFVAAGAVGHLPSRSRLAGAARSKTDVHQWLTAGPPLVLEADFTTKLWWTQCKIQNLS